MVAITNPSASCLAEYGLDGWTVPDLTNPDGVNLIGQFDRSPQAGR
jgi:hypothetical protein